MATAPRFLRTGTKVGGRYEVIEAIGLGGMGVVYKVREQVGAVSRIRALKTVLPQYAEEPTIVSRFREEAEKMCMLEHENIVPVLAYSEEGEFPYLVMPFIEGRTLKEYLAGHIEEHSRPLPLEDVIEIGSEIARGLETAHGFVNPETGRPQPMIHRDIKPGNVMIRVEGSADLRRLRVLIMDLGIAKVVSGEETSHTLTGVVGTVRYASPEQLNRRKDVDARADIYSLGMLLYEIYTGRHPFAGLNQEAVLHHLARPEAEEVKLEFPEGTPASFRDLVARCVAVDRERRPASMAEVREAMRRIVDEASARLAQAAEEARQEATAARSAAMEKGARLHAGDAILEAERLLADGIAAQTSASYAEAIRVFRSAATAFEGASDVALGKRQANDVAALASRVVEEASRLAALPPDLPVDDGRESLAKARSAVAAAEAALKKEDLESAARRATEADEALRITRSHYDGAIGRLAQRVKEIGAAFSERWRELGTMPEAHLAPGLYKQAAGLAKEAEDAQRTGRPLEAHQLYEGARAAVDQLIAFIESRRAESQAATRKAEVEAGEARADAERAHAEAPAASEAPGVVALCARALESWTAAERESAAENWVEALIRYRLAAQDYRLATETERRHLLSRYDDLRLEAKTVGDSLAGLGPAAANDPETRRLLDALQVAVERAESGDLLRSIDSIEALLPALGTHAERWRARVEEETAERTERLSTLRLRARRLAERAELLPRNRAIRAVRKRLRSTLGQAERAVEEAREGDAIAALDAVEEMLDGIPALPTEPAAARRIPVAFVAAGGLLVVVAAAFVVLRRPAPNPLPEAPPVEQAAAPEVAPAVPPAPAVEPPPGKEPPAAPVEVAVAPPVAPEPPRPTVAPPVLRFGALEPRALSLEALEGKPVIFQAPLRPPSPDPVRYEWEINGRRAENASGPRYQLGAAPGSYRVRVRAVGPAGASIDNAWNLTIKQQAVQPEPVKQAALPVQPKPVPPVQPEPVEPEPVRQALRTEPVKPRDLRAEAGEWVRAYCGAFERKDVDALIELGHLQSRMDAARLQEALENMRGLRLDCTNEAIDLRGDQAVVSFDRTDYWTDPMGKQMQRTLPRITKTLRRQADRWIAAP